MIKISDYSYELPPELIAKKPSEPRDSCRLFVYDIKKDKITFDYFYNLQKYLPKNSFIVLNDTKVLPTRVIMYKQSGGKVEILFLVDKIASSFATPRNDNGVNIVPAIVDRKINVGETLSFLTSTPQNDILTVGNQENNIFYLKFNFSKDKLFELLKKYGKMPIPPYIKNSPLSETDLREKYQTIFAKTDGSTAAPTASLHFTQKVFDDLKRNGTGKYFVTLNVGLGTFGHIGDKEIKSKKLHQEYWEISESAFQAINEQKINNKKLFAVGTTVVRTLESSADESGKLTKKCGLTDLFIYPPYDFKIIDGMITNFHLPKSSLVILVDAFLKYKKSKKTAIDLYKLAVREKYKFYSFGDAMLII